MRRLILLGVLVLAGCDSFGGGSRADNHRAASPAGNDLVLIGEFDNHEQVQMAGASVAVPHVRETLRLAENDRSGHLWLWRIQSGEGAGAAESAWLYRIATLDNGNRYAFTPYRALDDAARAALVAGKDFKFDDKQWAELTPCTLNGERKDGKLVASADVGACSALLPGLGATAALLPLKLSFDGDMLSTVTFADQARGADASIDARRVRFFTGWSAINGGGPKMRAGKQRLAHAPGSARSERRRPRADPLARRCGERLFDRTGSPHLCRTQTRACCSSTSSRTLPDRPSTTPGPIRRARSSASIWAGCRSV